MPFSVLIIKLCARSYVRYFLFNVASPGFGVIDADRERDSEVPKINKGKLQVWGDSSFLHDTLDTPTPNESVNASRR